MSRTSDEQKQTDIQIGNHRTDSVVENCIEIVHNSSLPQDQQKTVLKKFTQIGAASHELTRLDAEIKEANTELKATRQFKHLKDLQQDRKRVQAAQVAMNQHIIGIMDMLGTKALPPHQGVS